MKRAFALSALAIAALSGVAAGNVVNLGNLVANNDVRTVPFVVPAGGAYTSYTVTVDWSTELNDLDELIPWSSEARWNLYDSTGTTAYVLHSYIASSGWDGSGAATTLTWTGLMPELASGTSLSFGYYQFMPFLNDARWNNVSISFGNLTATIPDSLYIGEVAAGANLTITTGGSLGGDDEFADDTMIALYDSSGNFIAYDNDGGPDAFSQLVGTLEEGTYYAAVADFVNGYNDPRYGFDVRGGFEVGTTTLSLTDGINSYATAGEALGTGDVNWYSFNVVPTPGAVSLLGVCGVMGARRRRR